MHLSSGVTLKSLNLIKWKREQFRLVERVSAQWNRFGIQLGIQADLLEGWKHQYLGDATKCWIKVMGHWLGQGGSSEYPPSWEGVYKLLEDVQYVAVASELKQFIENMQETK